MGLRLGTRGSPLALAQAHEVAGRLAAAGAGAAEIVTVSTMGDRVQDRPLAEIGGKALWTKELDAALIEGRIDCAVHSMKDVETWLADGIVIAAILPRADVSDRLIGAASLAALPRGARVGTSSPRRAAQIGRARPDLEVAMLRGNVQTRLDKVAAGEFAATLLASAGLIRLGMGDVGVRLPPADWLPAPAQGAIGITARAGDVSTLATLMRLDHGPSSAAVRAERALLEALGATCRTPVGALSCVINDGIALTAEILSEDGREWVARATGPVPLAHGEAAARGLAAELLAHASPALHAAFTGPPSPLS